MRPGIYILLVKRIKQRSVVAREKGKSLIRHGCYFSLSLSSSLHLFSLSSIVAHVSSRCWQATLPHEIGVDRLFLPEIRPYPDAWLIVTKVRVSCIFLDAVGQPMLLKIHRNHRTTSPYVGLSTSPNLCNCPVIFLMFLETSHSNVSQFYRLSLRLLAIR